MGVFEQLVWLAAGSAVLMSALWMIQKRTGDAGIVDAGWSAGLGGAALLYALTSEGDAGRRLLLACCAGLWSFRLAAYLLFNRVLKGPEDGRYQTLRARWGSRAQIHFFLFFQFQALLVVLFSVPFLVVSWNRRPGLDWIDMAGVGVWLAAIAGEWAADRQLAAFRADPGNRGKTCRRGLWRYSRHPNYFFEWIHWGAYVLWAWGSPWWWVALAGPALMLLFLYRITGIPATEARALESRGEDYRRYQQTTSAFFPWFPKERRR